MNKPKIFIGVPNLGHLGISLSFRLREWYHSKKYAITIVEVTGVRPLEIAFNILHKQFLESDCAYFFTINDDEHLQPDALDILLAHDKDIVIPLGLKWHKDNGPMPCVGVREGATDVGAELAAHFENLEKEITATEIPIRYINPTSGYKGLRQCDRVGNSGILIKRHVMEAIPVGTFRLVMAEDRTNVLVTEDYILCDAMIAAGFDIWVDCSLVLDHYKEVNLHSVKKLMVAEHLAGYKDAINSLEKMMAAGATHEQAVTSLFKFFAAKQAKAFPEKVKA